MLRRLTHTLAAAALALGIAAGAASAESAIAGQIAQPPRTIPPGVMGGVPTAAVMDYFLEIGDLDGESAASATAGTMTGQIDGVPGERL
jgi:hypothetical protein